jgi:hypothetical protein
MRRGLEQNGWICLAVIVGAWLIVVLLVLLIS